MCCITWEINCFSYLRPRDYCLAKCLKVGHPLLVILKVGHPALILIQRGAHSGRGQGQGHLSDFEYMAEPKSSVYVS